MDTDTARDTDTLLTDIPNAFSIRRLVKLFPGIDVDKLKALQQEGVWNIVE